MQPAPYCMMHLILRQLTGGLDQEGKCPTFEVKQADANVIITGSHRQVL